MSAPNPKGLTDQQGGNGQQANGPLLTIIKVSHKLQMSIGSLHSTGVQIVPHLKFNSGSRARIRLIYFWHRCCLSRLEQYPLSRNSIPISFCRFSVISLFCLTTISFWRWKTPFLFEMSKVIRGRNSEEQHPHLWRFGFSKTPTIGDKMVKDKCWILHP